MWGMTVEGGVLKQTLARRASKIRRCIFLSNFGTQNKTSQRRQAPPTQDGRRLRTPSSPPMWCKPGAFELAQDPCTGACRAIALDVHEPLLEKQGCSRANFPT